MAGDLQEDILRAEASAQLFFHRGSFDNARPASVFQQILELPLRMFQITSRVEDVKGFLLIYLQARMHPSITMLVLAGIESVLKKIE